MAAYGPAIDRIVYLLTGGGRVASPATISGGESAIYSYSLAIVTRLSNGTYAVKRHADNSATTNRHIRAAHSAMKEIGFFAICEDRSNTIYHARTLV